MPVGEITPPGASLSGAFTGPRPVPKSSRKSPGRAALVAEMIGSAVLTSMIAAGPDPKFAVKIPKFELTTRTGAGWLATPLKVTITFSRPTGVLDGRIALIWPADTYVG